MPVSSPARAAMSYAPILVIVALAVIGYAVLVLTPRPELAEPKPTPTTTTPATTAPTTTTPVATPTTPDATPTTTPAPTPAASGETPPTPSNGADPDIARGEAAFKIRCAICHLPDARLVGPPMREAAALYKGNPAGIVAWTKAPSQVPKRPGYPMMLPIIAPDDELMAIAKYVLTLVPDDAGTPATNPETPTAPIVKDEPLPEAPTDAKIARGLTVSLQAKSGGAVDVRNARVLALYVPEGEAASPFIAPGPFTATFTGNVNKDVWDFITFSAEGTGSLKLSFGEKVVLDVPMGDLSAGSGKRIKINKGENPFTLVYTSPEKGDAKLRVFWSAEEIPVEPLPASVFSHNAHEKELWTATRVRHGRELAATLRCTKCHATEAKAETGVPELATDAPDLREVGGRLNEAWMASWIRDPKAMRAHASMPSLLRPQGKTPDDLDKEAASMAAYLASLGKPVDGAVPDDEDTRNAGGHLFAKLGCVACHAANDDKPAHIELNYVKEKFKPAALVQFLKEPSKHYAWIKMPTFGFSDEEAKQLAAYLLHTYTTPLPKTLSGGDANIGKALMAGSGCANCHQVEGMPPIIAPKLADLAEKNAQGCLGADETTRGRAPDFKLAATDRNALRAFLTSDQTTLNKRNLSEFAERRIAALNCIACHQRDGQMSVLSGMGSIVEELTASLPEAEASELEPGEGEHGEGAASENPAPLLTFAGDKLRPEWMAKFIAGKIPYRPRPWLNMRMPAFPAGADFLAKGLVMSHGLPPVTPADPPSPGPTAEDGQRLFGQDGGFNCVQCHSLGSAPAVAVFEAPGINLGYVNQRLQKDYFHRWMRNPLRFDSTTRMPKFAQDDGTTPLTDVLEGNAHDQFEAIYQYLNEISKETDFPH